MEKDGIEVTNTSSINVPQRSNLFGVEQKDWDRIKSLVGKIETLNPFWQNAGFFSLSATMSFLTAFISIEGNKKTLFLVATAFTFLITLMCFRFNYVLGKASKDDRDNIVEEMEAMEIKKGKRLKRNMANSKSEDPFDFLGLEEDYEDELYEEAKKVVVEAGKASTSFLQRKLRIGYSRASRLMDVLEDRGIVGPLDGSSARKILIDS